MTAEDLLSRTFAEVTDSTEYPITPMATVVARTQAIRGTRRRRIAYVAAAAVFVVGGLSAAVALHGGGDTSPPAPAGPLGKLALGAPPKLDYIDGDTFVSASGQRIRSSALAHARASVAWDKGVLVSGTPTSRHPFPEISFVSGDGASLDIGCGTPSFAVPAYGGDPVYWLSDKCKPSWGGSFVEGSTHTPTSKGAALTPIGKVAGGIVVSASAFQLRIPSHALVIPQDNRRWVPLHLAFPRTVSEAGGLVAGQARGFEGSAVVDARTGAVKWRAPLSVTLGRFSTSGRYIAGIQSLGRQQPGVMGDYIGIWDADTGHEVLHRELPGLIIDDAAWEADDSLLLVVEDRTGQEAIIRVGLDGTVTRTTPAVAGLPRPDEGRPPLTTLRLAETP